MRMPWQQPDGAHEGEPVEDPPVAQPEGDSEPEPEPEPVAVAPEIDYDLLATKMIETQEARDQARQRAADEKATRDAAQAANEPTIAQMRSRMKQLNNPSDADYDPDAALELSSEIGARLGRESARKEFEDQFGGQLTQVGSLAAQQAFSAATEGLTDAERKRTAEILQEKNWNPLGLADDAIAGLVITQAKWDVLHSSGRANAKPVPDAESTRGHPAPNLDPDVADELASLEKVYKANGMKFDPDKILARARERR